MKSLHMLDTVLAIRGLECIPDLASLFMRSIPCKALCESRVMARCGTRFDNSVGCGESLEQDANPIRTLGDYSKPSHEGYMNTIELLVGKMWYLFDLTPSAPGVTFEARVQYYMASHTKRMERFENAIFKQREEIDDKMAEMFRLLKELTTSRAPKKVLIKEVAKSPITKNINSISLARGKEEKNDNDYMAADDDINETDT
nr:hypothetical protein [Tanacetum cinerariifolium]